MSNNFTSKLKNLAPNNNTKFRQFQTKRTQTHRIHSLESEIQKKKFAQEYSKITSQFKNILKTQRRSKQSNNSQMRYQSSLKKHHSLSTAEKVHLKSDNMNKTSMKIFMKNTRINLGLNHPTLSTNIKEGTTTATDLFIHEQKRKKINENFEYIKQMINHFENLYRIREDLDDFKNNYENIIRSVKKYIFNFNSADVSRLDQLLKIQIQQKRLRCLMCLEKIVVIGVMDSLLRECEMAIENQAKSALDAFIGVYYSILSFIAEQKIGEKYKNRIKALLKLLEDLEFQKRKDLASTIDFLYKKIPGLYRFNQNMLTKVKENIVEAKLQGYKINKFFYQLLTNYSRNINESDLLNWNRNLLDGFATAPSPHLPFNRVKGNLTIVLQFEGVLCLMKSNGNKKNSIKLRPYANELIETLKKVFQVIIFTSLMPEQIQSCEVLSEVNCILYKYHNVRYRGALVKDISRLGRKLEEVILLDDQVSRNLHAMNKQNTLIVDTWKGNMSDEELRHVEKILIQISSMDPNDVRVSIAEFQKKVEVRETGKNVILEESAKDSVSDRSQSDKLSNDDEGGGLNNTGNKYQKKQNGEEMEKQQEVFSKIQIKTQKDKKNKNYS